MAERESPASGPDAAAGPDATAGTPAGSGVRALWLAVAALMLGAGVLWWSSRLTWFVHYRQLAVRGMTPEPVDGASRAAVLVPIALVAVAAVAGVVATSGLPRRIVGMLLALAGAGAVGAALGDLGAVFGQHPSGYPLAEILAARGMAVLGGLLVLAGGVVVLSRSARLPSLGARYRAPAAQRPEDSDRRMWQELSEGDDPTVDPAPDPDTGTGGDRPAGEEPAGDEGTGPAWRERGAD